MAGARTVEEILERGGANQFDITMFGEEPTGNYNRILLSNVLNGSYKEDEIFLNPLAWYEENNIRLYAGKRASGLLRRAKLVYGEDGEPEPYDKLIIATGSRAVHSSDGRNHDAGRQSQARRVRVPHAGRLPQDRRMGARESRPPP